MSDPAVAAQRQQQRQQGLIAGLVTLPFRFFGVLCGALLLLVSEAGRWMTGQVLNIDGGWVMRGYTPRAVLTPSPRA